MDGASLVPAPVLGETEQAGSRGECPETLFYHEEFAASSSFALAYLPLPGSEHVYLCPDGGLGDYQREDVSWARDAGSRTVSVLPGMGAVAGDVIAVEYAYYAQAPGPSKCIASWSPVVFPGPVVISNDEYGKYTPYGTGIPAVPPNQGGFYGISSNYSQAAGIRSGPPIAPGSLHSWETLSSCMGHAASLYGGTRAPKWSTASYLRLSTWVQGSGIAPSIPGDSSSFQFAFFTRWFYPAASNSKQIRYTFSYVAWKSEWTVAATVQHAASNLLMPATPISGVPVNPYDGAAHKYVMQVDAAAKRLTFTADGGSWTMTDDRLWPSGPEWADPAMPSVPQEGMLGTTGMCTNVSSSGAAFRTDGMTFESDVQWCEW